MIEKRDNLLSAWAIHCDTPDCHIETLSVDEVSVTRLATGDGWAISGNGHICPDCTAGASPMDIINASGPSAPQYGAPQNPPVPDPSVDLDEDTPSPHLSHEGADGVGLAPDVKIEDLFQTSMKRATTPGAKLFVERGDTIPGVTAKAEDEESPAALLAREARVAREAKRKADASKKDREKTRLAMGGVNDMLDNFDGMFGGNNTWDD